jgi:hypothetical protein
MKEQEWVPSAKAASLKKWANGLRKEAKRLFLKDKTHGHMLFSFNGNDGLISVNPIPPKTDQAQLNASIINAVKEHDLYGIIFIGEAWVYFPKEKDHTARQLLDGEMRVSDLNDEDKKEALFLRVENRDGDCLLYLDEIVRDGDSVKLGESRTINGEERSWFSDE